MSASIYYRVIATENPYVGVLVPQAFIASIERAFGVFPCNLDKKDIPKLEGMAAMHSGSEASNPYQKLIDAINDVGAVELYARY